MHEASDLPFEVLACLDDLKSVFLKIRLIPSESGGIFVHDKCLIPLPVVFENCLQTGKVEVNQHIDFDFIGSNPRQFRDCPSRCFLKKSPLKVIVFMEVISLVQRSAALNQGIFFSRIALPVVVLPQISAKGKPVREEAEKADLIRFSVAMKTKFKTAKELMKKPYLRREDFPDDLWTAVENYHVAIAVLDACREKYDDIPQDHRIAVENYFVADTVLDEYREKYGDDLVDLAIDCGSP
jgi:hypothetical protein